jgi:hypothetical protein
MEGSRRTDHANPELDEVRRAGSAGIWRNATFTSESGDSKRKKASSLVARWSPIVSEAK